MLRKIFTQIIAPLSALSLLLGSPVVYSEEADEPQFNVMLAGGSLHICSSMSPNQCKQTDWITDEMRQAHIADLSPQRIERAKDAVESYAKSKEIVDFFDKIDAIKQEMGKADLVLQRDFNRALSQFERDHDMTISNHDWYLITDHLEYAQTNHEFVNHAAAATPYGANIMAQFSDMAKAVRIRHREPRQADEAPLILVVTASARDSYDAVSFYLNAFAETGARVQWLGIDAPLHRAIEDQACEKLAQYQASINHTFDRARVFPQQWAVQQQLCQEPQHLLDLIADADGIFINGGDQSLTRQAFYRRDGQPSAWLDAIQQRVSAGSLAIGGTSAGSAIQPSAPMISNGSSEQALLQPATAKPLPPARDCEQRLNCPNGLNADSLTYHEQGGIGVFPFALIDTHFSERQRQARLIALGADTQTSQAVGVDETTALVVDTHSGAFKVIGQHGVFFAQHMRRLEHDAGQQVAATFSYVLAGSRGLITNATVKDVVFSSSVPERAPMRIGHNNNDTHFIDALNDWCGGPDASYRYTSQSFSLHQRKGTKVSNTPQGCQVLNADAAFWLH